METRFKMIISNNNLYKEIEISPDDKELTIGTKVESVIRLRKELFFEPIELRLMKKDNEWNMVCSDNVYISVGDVRKLMMKSLVHGDFLEIRYQNSENIAFYIDFLIDFEDGKRKYERRVSVANFKTFTIGATPLSNIRISSPYVYKDNVQFINEGQYLTLNIADTTYGVYHNGNRAVNGEKIKNGDFFSLGDFFFYYKNGELWTEIREDMVISGANYVDSANKGTYPKFNRNTRIKTHINDEKIEILDPPSKREKPKNNLFMKLLPSMGMIIATVVMGSMGGTMIIFSAISGAMAIITAVVGVVQDKKEYKKAVEGRIITYNQYVEKKREEIEGYRKEEKDALEEMYISQQAEKEKFGKFSSDLFERNKDDEDFLSVRLGSGNIEAKRELDYKKKDKLEDEDELQVIPELLYNEYKYITDAPVVCNFKACNAVGVVGAEAYRYQALKNIVLDIIARQYFSDVKFVFVAEQQHKEQISWMRILPHVYNDILKIRNIVTDDESKNIIFEYLYKELTIREQNKEYDYHLIVFFYDEYGFKNHPISKFVDKAKDLGVTFVFFGQSKECISSGCDYIACLRSEKNATLINAENKFLSIDYTYPSISDEDMKQIVSILAPVYTEEISLEGTLTKNISMFELLNIIAVDDLNLADRWAGSQVFKSMAAPIGVSKTGVVSLDLHDKAHGPHGLVAGTTGSGKSEILQTYILAMATLFHPYEVGFVIIDFKGGGMVNQFKELPHLLGAITNIDGKEINRSLKSIKAELQKRQRLFAEADVNHIDKYIRKYKAGEVEVPLPHLIIIVDEFAELKAEQPEFMKELISAARIGRSLGVHLILATQKPSGQVNEQIWSNSRFKLCLKVQSQEDSNEVIKSPLAAEIKEPGRAYLQVGNNEIFELFQSAYSGASEKAEEGNVKEFDIFCLTESGRRVPIYSQKKKKGMEGSATQLDAIVRYVHDYSESCQLVKLPDICLPSLEKVINFPTTDKLLNKQSNIEVELGVYDDPDNQYQRMYTADLTNQNMMIIGSSQSGKTNLLQNIIRSISTKYTPQEVNIYIIDFASMVLKTFEKLNHVGGVVTASEDEKLKNLMKLLQSEIETRKEKLLSVGVSSFSAYKEAGKDDLPQIVLIIDNLTALKELYFQEDDELLNLCREGLSVGISIVIANAQTTGIGYKYLSSFSCRIAMFCNDSSEYGSLFDHCSERIEDIHGRCIVDIDKTHLECQTYLAFEGEKEIDRVMAIKQYICECNEKNPKVQANIIPVIPEILTAGFAEENFMGYMEERGKVAIGLDYASVTPLVFDFRTLGVLAISGRESAGKHNFMKYVVHMLDKVHPETTEVHIIDGIGRKLSVLENRRNVSTYGIMPENAIDVVKNIEAQLKGRYEALASGDVTVTSESKTIVLILNNYDAIEAICNDMNAIAAYKNITGKYKNMNVCVLLGGIENTSIPYTAPEIVKKAKEAKHFVFFDDITSMKILDMPLSVMRDFKKPIEIGDCYYIKDNECAKVKTVLD